MPFAPISTRWLYRRLGRHYPTAAFAIQLWIALSVSAGAIGLLSVYYSATWAERFEILAVAEILTVAGMTLSFFRVRRRVTPVRAWMEGPRDPDAALAAWSAAVHLPMRVLRRDVVKPASVVAAITSAFAVYRLDLSAVTFVPIIAGAAIAVAYSAILQYFAMEIALRPVLDDLDEDLPRDFPFRRTGLPLRVKLLSILPAINVITGLVVAAITSGGHGSLAVSVLVATGVAFTLSLELSVLLSQSIMRPLLAVNAGLMAVRDGRYDVRVPVASTDELGAISDGFNRMAAGLAERKRLLDAFGTYLDRDVAAHLIASGFSERGVEVEVSILFCDVRGFTPFAAGKEAGEVVERLNQLFEVLVPIVTRHGGHVDKFIGDGLLAVFGAPQPFDDHADRALAAGREMARTVSAGDAGPLRVGVGINTGRVVAGSIGGAGRLNYSVIGDPVNVAARVEAATRRTDDDVLVTAATRARLRRPVELVPRGPVDLRGGGEPVELFAAVEDARGSRPRGAGDRALSPR